MKRTTAAVIIAGTLALAGTALAGPWGWGCTGVGPGAGRGLGWMGTQERINIQELKKFQNEVTPLRNDLMLKQAELHNELLKESPDRTRIKALRKDMFDLRSRLRALSDTYGYPGPGYCKGYGRGMGQGPGMMGPGY